jgi:hypothetical protein
MENQLFMGFLVEPIGYLLRHFGLPNKCQHPKDLRDLISKHQSQQYKL